MSDKNFTIGDFELFKESLGAGAQGEVVKARHKFTGQYYAVKILPLNTDTHKNAFQNEVTMTALCQSCSHVVPFIKSFQYCDFGFMVMEKMKFDLFEIINDTSKLRTEDEVASVFFQICTGIAELHAINVAHLDIKPENILLDKKGHVHFCDFGAATTFQKNELQTGVRGTLAYICPEMKSGIAYEPAKADMWSLGILLYVLLTGTFPFSSKNAKKVKEVDFSELEGYPISELCLDLLVRLLSLDANKRINIEQTINHPWFYGMRPNVQKKVSLLHKFKNKINPKKN